MAFKEYKGLDLSKVADEVLGDWEKNKSFEKSIMLKATQFLIGNLHNERSKMTKNC